MFHSLQIGGATARIGDPSGRLSERPLLSTSSVEDNASSLKSGVSRFFQGSLTYAAKRSRCLDVKAIVPKVLDNFQWYKYMNLLEFLRVAGYNSRVNTMLGRERSVCSYFILHQRVSSSQLQSLVVSGLVWTQKTGYLLLNFLTNFCKRTTSWSSIDRWGVQSKWADLTNGETFSQV